MKTTKKANWFYFDSSFLFKQLENRLASQAFSTQSKNYVPVHESFVVIRTKAVNLMFV